MESTVPIRIFIGSGEASLIERKVLIYSVREHTRRELEIYVFNGTHNSVEIGGKKPFPAPMPLDLKYRNVTEFSLYRFLVPKLCNGQGKAIYLDSDMLCLGDIGELFDTSPGEHHFLAKRNAHSSFDSGLWDLGVMLIECSRSRFDLEKIFEEIDAGIYAYSDFTRMSPEFLKHHPYRVGELDARWNVFDRQERDTRLIHFTNLESQPWKYPNHPYEKIWLQYFREAVDSGEVTERDIELSRMRSCARPGLLKKVKL